MPPGSTRPFRLHSLGRLDLRGPDGTPVRSVLQQPKRLALLAYLAVAAPRDAQRRDPLLGLFWPELDQESARNALNQALFHLRRSLGDDVLQSHGHEQVSVNRQRLWCDVVEFERAVQAECDQAALELYQGDFLDGLSVGGVAPEFEHWVDRQQARLREMAVTTAWRLVGAEEKAGNGAGAARWGWRAFELYPADEPTCRSLIDLLERQGDRTGALGVFETFARRLSTEYDLEPSPQLLRRIQEIREAPAATAKPAPSVPDGAPRAHAPTGPGTERRKRLIVLPFRMLREDPETDFLSFSLPDAITSSLAGLRSLVVRSNLAALPFADGRVDLREVATRADVDVILTGTLLRDGERLRVSCQLTDASDGTLLWSQTSQVTLHDLFEVQEQLARRVVSSLALPLSNGERRTLEHDPPANSRAYELFLRANELSYVLGTWEAARDLYLESLRLDPDFAPAWARLARCYRLLAKYRGSAEDQNWSLAEDAFRRALRLNPDLSIALNLYAQLEVDLGRAPDAMVRLLWRARGTGGDAELFAGLVHACRFCGLLDASRAAHDRARSFDPYVSTSVAHTYWMMGDYPAVLAHTAADIGYLPGLALASMDRTQEAIDVLRGREGELPEGRARAYVTSLRALLEGDRVASVGALEAAAQNYRDGEGIYYVARSFARLGEPARALHALDRMVEDGFFCSPPLQRDPWLDPLRDSTRFQEILHKAETLHRQAVRDFARAGGEDVLP